MVSNCCRDSIVIATDATVADRLPRTNSDQSSRRSVEWSINPSMANVHHGVLCLLLLLQQS